MKVPVKFDVDFTTNEVIPIHIGRFSVGEGHIARLVLDKDGRIKLLIPREAIDDGSVLVGERMPQVSFFGFGKPEAETQ